MTVKDLKIILSNFDDNLLILVDSDGHANIPADFAGLVYEDKNYDVLSTENMDDTEIKKVHEMKTTKYFLISGA